MNKKKLSLSLCIVGALVTLAAQTHAQTEPPAPAEPSAQSEPNSITESPARTESSSKADMSSNTETAAQAEPSVGVFIAKLDSGTRAIFENSKKDLALVRDGCRDLINDVLDLDSMTHTTNVEIWDTLTPAQRDLFRMAFEQRMIGNCIRQFDGYEGETLQLAGVRATEGGQLLATIRIGSQDAGKLVTWRLNNSSPDNMRAVDIITEGRSAVMDARIEFAAVLQSVNGDVEALIAFMRK